MSGHLLLLYRDAHDLGEQLAAARPPAGHRVVVACRPENRDVVFAGRDTVHIERPDIHTRPAAALALYRRLARPPDAGPMTIVAEPRPGTTGRDWIRAARCEAACDLAGPGDHADLICAYPENTPEPLLKNLINTHPELLTRYGRQLNPDHAEPVSVLRELTPCRPGPEPLHAPVLEMTGFSTITELGAVRREIAAHLAGLPTLVRTDFVAAVNELVTNGHLHGAPPLGLRMWVTGDRVECRVTDHGPGVPDPVAGYRPNPGSRRSGAGLWLARQLCDDIDMWRAGRVFTVRAATAVSAERNRQHFGAVARAETARTRAGLAAERTHQRRS
ncbi:ATP-binding protein [Actinoplanes sp. G11-F43]|uniref:ATP-binding protein n=1 Tax=Actinoplanes sp. G11-F43 TaxID=3424130 RepID=UPI003D344D34